MITFRTSQRSGCEIYRYPVTTTSFGSAKNYRG